MSEVPKDQELTDLLTEIQRKYWRFDPEEKARLIQRGPMQLPWPDMLRLHHLCCLEIMGTKRGAEYLNDEAAYGRDVEAGTARDLSLAPDLPFWPELINKLSSMDSPYKPRYCLVWQLKPGSSGPREADHDGLFMNASITHLGSVEVIKIDAFGTPKGIEFLGLNEVRHAVFARTALFRAAKIFYEDLREDEVVWVPLIYGVSWACANARDRDGTFTRWIGHRPVEFEEGVMDLGIGVGHQDFHISNAARKKSALFGLGSIEEVATALDVDDPEFEWKCRRRGLDPDKVLSETSGKNSLKRAASRLLGHRGSQDLKR
jgi:hypothetical protein